jgi:anaerobic sulfite reductase subunit B
MNRDEPISLIIEQVRQQTPDIRSFNLRRESAVTGHGIGFIPGQVALLRVPNEQPAYFAFATAPEDPELEILVKRKIGASNCIFDMREGERIELQEVAGRGFDLGGCAGRDLAFVAMGIGVAPLRSVLRHVVRRRGHFGRLILLYGVRTPGDFCYRHEMENLEQAGVELHLVISRPDGHVWPGPTGYVQSLFDSVVPSLASPVALVCGSLPMMEQARHRLLQLGFQQTAILTNY